ncbi:uncharacterized protein EV420DRAFT_1487104 [Desarmillaria tabescens]|uniref:Uncharacterized protein n=1 Tax=Armillaria tabescens TaxID=1929756 RepID=A0AA39J8P2_ARMTA|nr:uncharacterized protein EV420DRAFT_1487104 [Desarmillaria tabescens]KAK0437427.1 hypothetical protein EV420DRAFT_1487104 [Desarmillaria tabescens]
MSATSGASSVSSNQTYTHKSTLPVTLEQVHSLCMSIHHLPPKLLMSTFHQLEHGPRSELFKEPVVWWCACHGTMLGSAMRTNFSYVVLPSEYDQEPGCLTHVIVTGSAIPEVEDRFKQTLCLRGTPPTYAQHRLTLQHAFLRVPPFRHDHRCYEAMLLEDTNYELPFFQLTISALFKHFLLTNAIPVMDVMLISWKTITLGSRHQKGERLQWADHSFHLVISNESMYATLNSDLLFPSRGHEDYVQDDGDSRDGQDEERLGISDVRKWQAIFSTSTVLSFCRMMSSVHDKLNQVVFDQASFRARIKDNGQGVNQQMCLFTPVYQSFASPMHNHREALGMYTSELIQRFSYHWLSIFCHPPFEDSISTNLALEKLDLLVFSIPLTFLYAQDEGNAMDGQDEEMWWEFGCWVPIWGEDKTQFWKECFFITSDEQKKHKRLYSEEECAEIHMHETKIFDPSFVMSVSQNPTLPTLISVQSFLGQTTIENVNQWKKTKDASGEMVGRESLRTELAKSGKHFNRVIPLFKFMNLPKVTLSALTETGQAESTIPVLKQQSYTDSMPVIQSTLADTPCSDLVGIWQSGIMPKLLIKVEVLGKAWKILVK